MQVIITRIKLYVEKTPILDTLIIRIYLLVKSLRLNYPIKL
jgi:hypothetical protein